MDAQPDSSANPEKPRRPFWWWLMWYCIIAGTLITIDMAMVQILGQNANTAFGTVGNSIAPTIAP